MDKNAVSYLHGDVTFLYPCLLSNIHRTDFLLRSILIWWKFCPDIIQNHIQAIVENVWSCHVACANGFSDFMVIIWATPKRCAQRNHTMDMLWENFQWILPLYMNPISFQSKASVVCSVTTAVFIDFCLKKLNVFSQHIGKKTNEYLNSTEQIPRNWNVDKLSMSITS